MINTNTYFRCVLNVLTPLHTHKQLKYWAHLKSIERQPIQIWTYSAHLSLVCILHKPQLHSTGTIRNRRTRVLTSRTLRQGSGSHGAYLADRRDGPPFRPSRGRAPAHHFLPCHLCRRPYLTRLPAVPSPLGVFPRHHSRDSSAQVSLKLHGFGKSYILNRNPPSPIIRLLIWSYGTPLEDSYIASLLDKADTLGLRHLTVELGWKTWSTILRCILSLHSLKFLSLQCVIFPKLPPPTPTPTPINLNHLKSLCIDFYRGYPINYMNWLVPQLDALEDLHITSSFFRVTGVLDLKSTTMRNLKLEVFTPNLRISTPSLEVFELISGTNRFDGFENIQWVWEMPMLRKAVIQLNFVQEENADNICKMLNVIAHVQELHLDITEERVIYPYYEGDSFHALLTPYVDPPTFIKLKHLHLEICFHELNVQDLVTIIQHSPSLESLTLVHKFVRNKKKKLLRSMLPRNAEGNYRHVHYEDLHIAEKKEDLLRKLIKKRSSKRLKT